jgi:hypothetical protein
MRGKIKWVGMVVAVLLMTALPAAAKAPADRITVSGPGLEHEVEITGQDILANPWADEFLGAPLDDPLAAAAMSGDPYEVSFWMKDRVIYAFDYYPESEYIQLPGQDDPRRTTNVSTIIRPHGWYQASGAWIGLMTDELGTARAVSPATSTAESGAPTWLVPVLLAAGALVVSGAVAVRLRPRPATRSA